MPNTQAISGFGLTVAACWLLMAGAAGAQEQAKEENPDVVTKQLTIRIDNTKAGELADWWAAYAAQYDPFQFMREDTSPNLGRRGMNDSWFAVETQRVRKMGLQGIRLWFQIDWWEPINDNDDPQSYAPDYSGFAVNSPRMRSVWRFLNMCDAEGVEVGLNFGWKLGQPARQWIGSGRGANIADAEEHAESLIALLKYMRDVREYTCITQISLGNEHEYNYADLYPALNRRLAEEGMRDDYITWGIETNRGMERNLPYIGQVDTYTVHIYHRVDFAKEIERYYQMLGENGSKTGTKGRVWLSEFALGGNETFEHGLWASQALVDCANSGAYAIGGWRLSDQHLVDGLREMDGRDKSDHGLHKWGTWKWTPWMERPRDVYYSTSLLTRYVPRWSKVLKVTGADGLTATCFRKGEQYTIVVVNTSHTAFELDMSFAEAVGAKFRRHLYAESTLPADARDTVIPADKTLDGSALRDAIPARCMAVYTTLAEAVQVEVAPRVSRAKAGEPVRLAAKVLGAGDGPHKIAWSVDGGSANGTVDADGVYTPPAGKPAIEPVIVRAKLVGDGDAPRASDGLAVMMFEGEPKDLPNRPDVVVREGRGREYGGPGPRQIDLGQRVKVGTKTSRTVRMGNLGPGVAEYTITSSAKWLTATPTKGTVAHGDSAEVAIEVNTAGLKPGTWYIGYVTIDSPRGLGRDAVDVYFKTAK